MKTGILRIILIAAIFIPGLQAMAASPCSETCTDSLFTYCAHLKVYDNSAQVWTELCSSPIDTTGSYSFTNSDGTLKTQLEQLPDDHISITTSGGKGLGLSPRKKLLSQADLVAGNFTINLASTLAAWTSQKVADFYASRSSAITTIGNALTSEDLFWEDLKVSGAMRKSRSSSAQTTLAGLSSLYSGLSPNPMIDAAVIKRLIFTQFDQIDYYVSNSDDLREGLIAEVLTLSNPFTSFTAEQVGDLLNTSISTISRSDSSAVVYFSKALLEYAKQTGVQSLESIARRFRERVILNQTNLDSISVASHIDAYDPDIQLIFHHLSWLLLLEVRNVSQFKGLISDFWSSSQTLCPNLSHPTVDTAELCGLQDILGVIFHELNNAPETVDDGSPIYNSLSSDSKNYARVSFHGKFDEHLAKTAEFLRKSDTDGLAGMALLLQYQGVAPPHLVADYGLLIPLAKTAYVNPTAAPYSTLNAMNLKTVCSLQIKYDVKAKGCEESVIAHAETLKSQWTDALTFQSENFPINTSGAGALQELITYLGIVPLISAPLYREISP